MNDTAKRHKTKYAGVTWRYALKKGTTNKYEENFYIEYKIKGEKFEVVIKGKRRVSEVIMATTMREISLTV